MNIKNYPRLTVGIMAYNEEQYLKETIESILQQDYLNYQIIIADNASEDNTGKIALGFANKFENIRYIRHSQNIGALSNFNSLVESAKGEFFILAGAHDLWSKNFLSQLVDALDCDDDAVIAYAPTVWIDDGGKELAKKTGFVDTSGFKAVDRFNMVMWNDQHAMYGLYRLDALRKTRLQLQILGSGAVMLGELAIIGSFVIVKDAIWFRRVNRNIETQEERIQRYAKTLFSKQRRMVLPHWHIPLAYLTSVLRGKLPLGQRILLILSALTSLLKYGNVMLWDIGQHIDSIRTNWDGKRKV
jgi:glycosyltransferase involved in cell wall biosynthesis